MEVMKYWSRVGTQNLSNPIRHVHIFIFPITYTYFFSYFLHIENSSGTKKRPLRINDKGLFKKIEKLFAFEHLLNRKLFNLSYKNSNNGGVRNHCLLNFAVIK